MTMKFMAHLQGPGGQQRPEVGIENREQQPTDFRPLDFFDSRLLGRSPIPRTVELSGKTSRRDEQPCQHPAQWHSAEAVRSPIRRRRVTSLTMRTRMTGRRTPFMTWETSITLSSGTPGRSTRPPPSTMSAV
jgi:hypothetical protein